MFKHGHDQSAHRVRCEWGPTGAVAIPADHAVVVDVLSFTTTLTVALEHGIEVFPYSWKGAGAAQHALRHAATLAVGRFEALSRADARHVSLSPASIAASRGLAGGIERLVLPSPNGSTIAFALAEAGAGVLGACLRNADAVAAWLAPRLSEGTTCALIPAGERWPDDSLRPAIEDLWGAGAVLAGLVDRGVEGLSPEARAAEQAFRAVRPSLPGELAACASGVELIEAGFSDDVVVAGQLDASDVVPLLVGESFTAVRH
ncbi:2-phosphosulfolactate phosphatase [Nocardioides piscis]|uniref:Probable 2-phosphosulfolactate phosphatase n=1 Tax=Nocardioides piscis TaxID=2714938 RepID=A0A6G7YDG6_9ACTN|nr:2-phosphosulfolactate phosphatase [Nocardioides piscis]QIK74862.1 2-phosphosulfolactate phosphatase [Nocardioides piscis]